MVTRTRVALLSTAEVAAYFGVNVRTVHRWVQLGRLEPYYRSEGRTGPLLFDHATVRRHRR